MERHGIIQWILSTTVFLIGNTHHAAGSLVVAGTPDRSFNPAGLSIDSTGTPIVAGGYSGSLLVDLELSDVSPSVTVDQQNGTIYVAVQALTGLDDIDLGLVAIKPNGSLDRNFNSLGFSINDKGLPIMASGYSGSLIINLGGDEGPPSLDINQVTKQLAVAVNTTTGPGITDNIGVIAVLPDGTLDRSFNPLGFSIDSVGDPVLIGGYSGSLIIDLGGDEENMSLAIDQGSGRIIVAADTTTGPAPTGNLGVVVINPSGMLDKSFNPLGLSINALGIPVAVGGYSGSLIVNIGGDQECPAVAIDPVGRAIVVLQAKTGPGALDNIGVVAIKPDGTLDRFFNPLGISIDGFGLPVFAGGYSGSLLIDLGGSEVVPAIAIDLDGRIVIAASTTTGPGGGPGEHNLGIVVLMPDGMLDRGFNPSGISINSSGDTVAGGYSGSLIINFGANDFAPSVAIDPESGNIIAAITTNTGPGGGLDAFGVVVVRPNGSLDTSFNPSGVSIDASGNPVSFGGYAGSLLVDLGGDEENVSLALDQNGRIIGAVDSTTGPDGSIFTRDIGLIVVNGRALFPPPVPVPSVFRLPFVALAAA